MSMDTINKSGLFGSRSTGSDLARIQSIPPVSGGAQICKVEIAGFQSENYRQFDPSGYTVLCSFGESLDGLKYFPNSGKVVLSYQHHSQVIETFEKFIPNVAQDLAITETQAFETIQRFFNGKDLVVQPIGIQGKVYNVMRSIQNYAPMAYMTQAVTTAKTLGISGPHLVVAAPLTFVGSTYAGAMFFAYLGVIAGNNTVGSICNSTSYVLSRPMKGVEIVLNGLILKPISNVIGLPLMLNGTAEMASGIGIKWSDYTKVGVAFERVKNLKNKFKNSTVAVKAKKIFKIIFD